MYTAIYSNMTIAFMARQSLFSYFISKSDNQLRSPIIYGTKMYLHNHFKQLNISQTDLFDP